MLEQGKTQIQENLQAVEVATRVLLSCGGTSNSTMQICRLLFLSLAPATQVPRVGIQNMVNH